MTRTTYNGTSRRNKFKGTVDNDILIGGDGNDTLNGGDGDDYIIGHSLLKQPASRGEVDRLTGGRGRDLFVLANGYLGDKNRGYALITDFSVTEDTLILAKGLSYTFKRTASGTQVFCGGDLVARLQGLNIGDGIITAQPWAVFV